MNHKEKWMYRYETGEYVFVSVENYKDGQIINPETDYKIVIPEQLIGGLIAMLEDRGRIHEKDRGEDIKIIHRLIDVIQKQ